ncbi:MAG: nodulation protein NfeD [Alphaproteobacteria bacterium]
MRHILLLAVVLLAALAPHGAAAEGTVAVLDIKGAIGPATSDYIHRGFAEAKARNAVAVVIRMDTPGGLSTSMRDIIQDILTSSVPVLTYVTPSGARAASAGTYILYASHVAAMAPGTNLGAATPVAIGGLPGTPGAPDKGKGKTGDKGKTKAKPGKPTMADKAVNDATAYIRSLAQMRGRNVKWAEKAVREAASLSAVDARKQNVVDLIADSMADLLRQAHGREVKVGEKKVRVATKGATIIEIPPDWRTKFLAVITNPNIAYLMMLLGFYGLLYEFISPGAVVPGVVGGICMILALYALHVLPVNYAGLGLIVLGIALMTGEAFVPGFGVLGIGGVVAFAIGSVMLFETEVEGFELSLVLVAVVSALSAAFFALLLGMAVKARRRPVVSGQESMIGGLGQVIDWRGEAGHVRAQGEIWKAAGADKLKSGQRVRIARLKGLTLIVEPTPEDGE